MGHVSGHCACVAGFVWVMFWSTLMFNRPGRRLTLWTCAVCMCSTRRHETIVHLRLRHFRRFMIYICHNKNIPPKKLIHFSKKGMLAKLAVTCHVNFLKGHRGQLGRASRPMAAVAAVKIEAWVHKCNRPLSCCIHFVWFSDSQFKTTTNLKASVYFKASLVLNPIVMCKPRLSLI